MGTAELKLNGWNGQRSGRAVRSIGRYDPVDHSFSRYSISIELSIPVRSVT